LLFIKELTDIKKCDDLGSKTQCREDVICEGIPLIRLDHVNWQRRVIKLTFGTELYTEVTQFVSRLGCRLFQRIKANSGILPSNTLQSP